VPAYPRQALCFQIEALHIKYDYHNNWIIDNLPSMAIGLGTSGKSQNSGFFLFFSFTADGKVILALASSPPSIYWRFAILLFDRWQ
jgi:hypothetical protein